MLETALGFLLVFVVVLLCFPKQGYEISIEPYQGKLVVKYNHF